MIFALRVHTSGCQRIGVLGEIQCRVPSMDARDSYFILECALGTIGEQVLGFYLIVTIYLHLKYNQS